MNIQQPKPARPRRTPVEIARSFLTDAEAFLLAARTLDESGKVEASAPKYYLACHSVELILKAYILTHGGKEAQLREIGHDLTEALSRATERGLKPKDERTETLIEMLAPYHLEHRFRYRRTGYITLPVLDEACEIVDHLIKQIGPEVDQAMRVEIAAKRATAGKP
jgi:HEPN domain-containing protein